MTSTLEDRVSGHNGHGGGHGHGDHGGHEEHGTPDAVQKWYKKRKFVDSLINTTKSVHSQVYLDMEKDLLHDEKGRPDYDKLDKEDVRGKVLDKLVEGYKTHAKRLGANVKDDMSEEELDTILNEYVGVTKGQLKRRINKLKSEYTLDQHEAIRNEHVKKVAEKMEPVASGHFTEDDIESTIRYMGKEATDMLNADLLKTNPQALGNLLGLHKENQGALAYSDLVRAKMSAYVKEEYADKKIPEEHGHGKGGHGHAHAAHAPAHH